MGRNKGRTLNPADQARKLQRQREKEKNAAKRKEVRTAILGKKELPELRDELRRLESSGTKLDAKQASRKKMLQELISQAAQKEADEKAQNQSGESDPSSNLTNMFPNPEESIYYHPVLNPYGAPPPGMPQMYRPRAQPQLAPPIHPMATPHPHPMQMVHPHHPQRPPGAAGGAHHPAAGLPSFTLEPLPIPLENIPPPPDLPELELAFQCDPDHWPPPPPRHAELVPAAPAAPEPIAVPEPTPEATSDDTEEFGRGGLLLCDYEDEPAPFAAPAAATAPAPPLAVTTPSSSAKQEDIPAAVTTLIPASVRRRRQNPAAAVPARSKPAAAAAAASMETTAAVEAEDDTMDAEATGGAVPATEAAEGSSAGSFEAWMSDMSKLGVL